MVKSVIRLLVGGTLALGLQASAFDKVQITAERKRDEADRAKAVGEGQISKASEKVVYNVTVKNTTFNDLSALQVEYIVFVERQRVGQKRDQENVSRIGGTETVAALARQGSTVLTTKEVQLNHSNLTAGWYYANGARTKAEDSVVGVWIRVSENGQMIGEYMSPPTVKNRGWEKK